MRSDYVLQVGTISENNIVHQSSNGLTTFSLIRRQEKDNEIELSVRKIGYDEDLQKDIDAFCESFGITVISEKFARSNPYWKFFLVKYDWSSHQEMVASALEDNRLARLEHLPVNSVSVSDLVKVCQRRVALKKSKEATNKN